MQQLPLPLHCLIPSTRGPLHILPRPQDKTTVRRREDESPFRLLTTRREALALYREIWRVTALFDWPDDKGRLW